MQQSERLEEFKKSVENKFNVYNSLFLNLPYSNIENVGMLIPLLMDQSEKGLKKGLNPKEILDMFFEKFGSLETEKEKIDFMFRVIQYVERQVVLYDSVEDAAFPKLHRHSSSLSLRDYFQLVERNGSWDQIGDKLDNFSARIVLTAHPTQFYTPSVLDIITNLRTLILEDRIDEIDVADLVRGVAAISTGEPVTDQGSLLNHALNIGGTTARMEQRLESLPVDSDASFAGLTDFMCKCLGNFDRKLAGESWWLPMDVQASLGLTWQRLPGNKLPGSFQRAMKMQATRALESIAGMFPGNDGVESTTSLGRHLFVSTALNYRRITDIATNPLARWPMKNRPADSILAWRKAFKHRRSLQQSGRTGGGQ